MSSFGGKELGVMGRSRKEHELRLAIHPRHLDRVPDDLRARLARAVAANPPGVWLRATGYHEHRAGPLTLADLDVIAPLHPLRVQHQTGALWILNTAALDSLGPDAPPNFETETGRLWRADAWLRNRLGADPPALAPLGQRLVTP